MAGIPAPLRAAARTKTGSYGRSSKRRPAGGQAATIVDGARKCGGDAGDRVMMGEIAQADPPVGLRRAAVVPRLIAGAGQTELGLIRWCAHQVPEPGSATASISAPLLWGAPKSAAVARGAGPDHPEPRSIAIRDLRPTQMTVGYREVAEKRCRWRAACAAGEEHALGDRIVPVVLGLSAQPYILDRHHWLCALAAENVTEVPVAVVDDLGTLDQAVFWPTLNHRGWCHAYDAEGRLRDYGDILSCIGELQDDPFRSLASSLRRANGYAKRNEPFSEFIWADFLRGRLTTKLVVDDFEAALQAALELSRIAAASNPHRRKGSHRDLRYQPNIWSDGHGR